MSNLSREDRRAGGKIKLAASKEIFDDPHGKVHDQFNIGLGDVVRRCYEDMVPKHPIDGPGTRIEGDVIRAVEAWMRRAYVSKVELTQFDGETCLFPRSHSQLELLGGTVFSLSCRERTQSVWESQQFHC